MCVLCEMGLTPLSVQNDPNHANGVSNVTNTGDQNVDAVLIGTRWDTTSLTYTFPDFSSYFTDNPYEIAPDFFDQGYVDNFIAFNTAWRTASVTVMDMFGAVSGLSLTQVAPSTATPADIVFAQTSDSSIGTASGRFPTWPNEGHQWYQTTNYDATPVRGTYTWHTIMHETGHTMGLAHGHNPDSISGSFTGMAMTADRDSMEFSVMTYRSYAGDPLVGGYSNEQFGYAQTLMMYDIAALQVLYGANFGENAGNNTYTWSETTGEMFIDGVAQGAAGANRIFMTLWDGNGVDTFDLQNYDNGVAVDLSPGGWSVFDSAQLSNLGDGNFSRGNVFNALLYNNNSQSLIDNVIAGDGDDLIVGNRISNTLTGNIGDDTMAGAGGDDTLYGGADDDVLFGDGFAGGVSGVTLSGSGVITHGSIYDTMGTALDVTNLFAQFTDANVQGSDTNPHVTLRYSDATGGQSQWYSITVNAGSYITLDIDATVSLDSWINIYDASGTLLDFNDDQAGDPGSTLSTDSFFADFVGVTGTYFVEIGRWVPGDPDGGPLEAGDGYDLHVTVAPPPAVGSDGTAGNDALYGGGGDDTIYGGDGNDTLFGGTGADILHGCEGNDRLEGGSENDELIGDLGFDFLFGGGNADTMYGGGNNDRLYGGHGHDMMWGGNGSDSLYGDDHNDIIRGEDATDRLFGGTGNDQLFGGNQADSLYGGADNDTMYGETGADYLLAGAGNDSLYGGESNDTMIGEAGNDLLVGGALFDIMYGGADNDRMYGNEGTDTMYGGGGIDTLYGQSENDRIFAGTGADFAYGGSGSDLVAGDGGNDFLRGEGGNDFMYGGADTDQLYGDADNDTLFGGGGTDSLYGGTGADRLNGDLGADVLVGGVANDVLVGGGDNDFLYGGTESDQLFGNFGNDTLYGGDQGDTLYGQENNDRLYGQNGADDLRGGTGNDILGGGTSNDTLYGGAGNDQLFGGDQIDRLYGGSGTDIMFGGANADVFYFIAGDDTATIADFQDNVDLVRISSSLGVTSRANAMTFATESGGNVTFNFSTGDVLVVNNTTIAALTDDLYIV